jgi:hypothetical protein
VPSTCSTEWFPTSSMAGSSGRSIMLQATNQTAGQVTA